MGRSADPRRASASRRSGWAGGKKASCRSARPARLSTNTIRPIRSRLWRTARRSGNKPRHPTCTIRTYAPERILVVERDDLVDMLIRNRFHLTAKAVVVSRTGYPERVFAACGIFCATIPTRRCNSFTMRPPRGSRSPRNWPTIRNGGSRAHAGRSGHLQGGVAARNRPAPGCAGFLASTALSAPATRNSCAPATGSLSITSVRNR